MGWKIATGFLVIALAAVITIGELQLRHQWSRTVGSEAQIVAIVRGNQVAADRSISALQTQTEKAIATVSSATVSGLIRLVGNSAIGNVTLTGAINNLEQTASCLETDIADIENQTTSYLLCH